MKRATKLMLASPVGAAALALAACGGNEANESADLNLAETNAAGTAGSEADLEVNTLRVEVDRLRLAGAGGSTSPGAADATGATGATGQGGATAEGGAAGQGGGATGTGTGTDTPSNQSIGAGTAGAGFAETDLDGDGQITPAEFAVRELDRVDPAQKAAGADDDMRPYVSDEALNRVIESFRKLDANGDFRLTPAEFPGAAG